MLKECVDQLELRARALELENKLMLAHMNSMADKLCFCTWVEVSSQVDSFVILIQFKERLTLSFRQTTPSPSLSTMMSLQITPCTTRCTPNQVVKVNCLLNIQLMLLS